MEKGCKVGHLQALSWDTYSVEVGSGGSKTRAWEEGGVLEILSRKIFVMGEANYL